MDIYNKKPTCTLCHEEGETALYINLEWEALTYWRHLRGSINIKTLYPEKKNKLATKSD